MSAACYTTVVGTRGGGGGTPLKKLYRYVPPHRVGFLLRSQGLEREYA